MVLLALLGVALIAGACVSSAEPDVGEVIAGVCKNEDTDPAVMVSFKNDILPKLQMGCSCHNPTMGGSAIDTTGFSVGDYASLRRGGSTSHDKIVVDGDPCDSFIYEKLSDAPPTGVRMPQNGPYWSRTDMALIHDWIAEGAHDN